MKLKFLLVLVFNLLIVYLSFSQLQLKKKTKPSYITFDQFNSLNDSFYKSDTNLLSKSYYNIQNRIEQSYQDLGMMGTPIKLFDGLHQQTIGFELNKNVFAPYLKTIEQSKYYQSYLPVTTLKYLQGKPELIQIEVLHTQNINPRWNIGLDYKRLKSNNTYFSNLSAGLFNARIPSIFNADFFTHYQSKNARYHVFANYIWNKIVINESGGFADRRLFEANTGTRRVFDNVLNTASNTLQNNTIAIKQYYRIGHYSYQVAKLDSGKLDTLSFKFYPKLQFYHSIKFSNEIICYRNSKNTDTIYPEYLFYKTTNDSINTKLIENQIGMQGILLKNNQLHYDFAFALQQINVYQFPYFTRISNNSFIKYQLKYQFKKIELSHFLQQFLTGYNKNDFFINFKIKANTSLLKSELIYNSQQNQAPLVYNFFRSNHYYWSLNLKHVQFNYLTFKSELKSQILAIDAHFGLVNHFMAIKNDLPYQINTLNNFLYIKAKSKLKYKTFYAILNLIFQNSSIDERITGIPKLTFIGNFGYQNFLFKKNLLFQFGINTYYTSAYNALEYNPIMRNFVVGQSVKLGNYPIIDVYFNGRIKTMDLFFKLEHANAGLTSWNYYFTPNYPILSRVFRIGINWDLYY